MSGFCLILEPMPLVARDLAATARENLGLEPLVAATADAARAQLAALDRSSRVSLAFVHQAPADFARDDLRAALEACGAQIVLIGPGTEGNAPDAGWPALVWPFATEHVLALIRRLGGPVSRACKP